MNILEIVYNAVKILFWIVIGSILLKIIIEVVIIETYNSIRNSKERKQFNNSIRELQKKLLDDINTALEEQAKEEQEKENKPKRKYTKKVKEDK